MKHLEHLAARFVNWSAIYKHNTAKEVLDEVLGDLILIKDSIDSGEPTEEITKAYANCFMRLFDSAQRAGISPEMIRESFMTPSDHEEEKRLNDLYIMSETGWNLGATHIGGEAPMGKSRSSGSSYERREEKKRDDSYQYIPSYVPDSSSYSSGSDSGSYGGGDFGGGGASGDW